MEKKDYVPPLMERTSSEASNKFGHGTAVRTCESIDGVSVSELITQFGSPLFVFSENTIRQRMRAARRAFEKRYPKVQFAWSYKTNYLKAVCSVFHEEGSIAEVVSAFEYEKARNLGIPGQDILVNGPYKTPEFLRQAVKDGAKIHLDNLDELFELENIARETGTVVDAAIRVNMDTGLQPAWTKFGFNLENGEALRAVRRMKMNGLVRLVGLHTHIGTFVLDPEFYRTATQKLIGLARQVSADFGFDLEYMDLGGGFASNNTLHAQYLPGDQVVPTLDQYADAICDPLLDAYSVGSHAPKLYLESGRSLIDEAGWLISSVVAKKHAPDGRPALIIDAGINVLYTTTWYRLSVMPVRKHAGSAINTLLYGPLCMNIDVVRERVHLPPMDRGDAMVLHPVGAYNITQWMQFITYRPAVVMIRTNGEPVIIRERETLSNVEMGEHMLPTG